MVGVDLFCPNCGTIAKDVVEVDNLYELKEDVVFMLYEARRCKCGNMITLSINDEPAIEVLKRGEL